MTRPASGRIDLRVVALLAVMMVMGAALGWKAWLRDHERRTTLPAEPAPPPPPVTDVSDWMSRQVLLDHRERTVGLFEADGESLMDRCGSWRYAEAKSPDAIRLTYLDAWGKDAFTVALAPREDGAVATWHRIALNPPPPPGKGSATAGNSQDRASSGFYRFTETDKRRIDAAAWQRALAAVRDPAFSQLVPANMPGLDGFTLIVESCTDSRYHLVQRFMPHGPEHRDFLRAVREIGHAAGGVHPLPEFINVEESREEDE